MSTNTDRAIEIGHKLAAIDSAINHLMIGWRNAHQLSDKFDVYDTELFSELNDRREQLRSELVGMN